VKALTVVIENQMQLHIFKDVDDAGRCTNRPSKHRDVFSASLVDVAFSPSLAAKWKTVC
jgi:hypothetical protein